MKKIILMVLITLSSFTYAENLAGKYELKSSQINYLVTYLIKKATGTSKEAKGKGECKESCEFLVAAPLKSFQSKDSNRDLNMLKVTKADQFPLIVAKLKTKNAFINGQLPAEIEIDFSGIKKMYSNILLEISQTPDGFHAEGSFDLLLENHKVEKPSLLGVDIKDIVPVSISADWKKI